MYERTVATNVFTNKAMKTHADHNNEKTNKRGGLHPPPIPSLLRSVFSPFEGQTRQRRISLFFYAVVSELVGGTRGSKKEERRKGVRCRKEADSSPFRKIAWMVQLQNNFLFSLPDPNFNHQGWIIHSQPMTCWDGDKESLLYFASHNKFMTWWRDGWRRKKRWRRQLSLERQEVGEEDETGRSRERGTGDGGDKYRKNGSRFYILVASL